MQSDELPFKRLLGRPPVNTALPHCPGHWAAAEWSLPWAASNTATRVAALWLHPAIYYSMLQKNEGHQFVSYLGQFALC